MRIAGLVLLVVSGLCGDSWTLPQGLAVKDSGPRTYRFTMNYTTATVLGEVVKRQQIVGEYTRGLKDGEVMWKNVTSAEANGGAGPMGTPEKQEFMEGFRYHKNLADISGSLKPDFFKGFPPTAVFERSMVWDEEMIEMFGQTQFEHLKLNEPYGSSSNESIDMPGVGKFQNRNVELEWIGKSRRNGQDCALIAYSAYFNPLEIANGGIALKGRSHYWGDIWVSLETKQIEYATLREDVLGELKLAGQDKPQVISVFRSGEFVPVGQE
jgi:hypothetical protein